MSNEELEAFFKNSTDKQKSLLLKIVETSQLENETCERINRVYNSIKSGVYSSDGYSISVCEDEDDAAILSAKDRQELASIRDKIKGYMIEAVKIGIGNLGIISRNYKEYVGEDMPSK
jgi:hypothetical protein